MTDLEKNILEQLGLEINHQQIFKKPGIAIQDVDGDRYKIILTTIADFTTAIMYILFIGGTNLEIDYHGFTLRLYSDGTGEVQDTNEPDIDVATYGRMRLKDCMSIIEGKLAETRTLHDLDDTPTDEEQESDPIEELIMEWAVWCFREDLDLKPGDNTDSLTAEQIEYIIDFNKRMQAAQTEKDHES